MQHDDDDDHDLLPEAALPIPLADPKPWYASRTIIGSLMVLVSQTAALAGWDLDAPALTEIALQAVALVGGVVALWGRLRAEQPIAPLLRRG